MKAADRAYRLGEVLERTGLSARRVRQYERLGLLGEVSRTPGNQRTYSEQHVQRLEAIRRMRGADMSLQDIRLALRVLNGGGLGVDVEGMDRVLTLCSSIRARVNVTEELVGALRRRAVERIGDRVAPPGPGTPALRFEAQLPRPRGWVRPPSSR